VQILKISFVLSRI